MRASTRSELSGLSRGFSFCSEISAVSQLFAVGDFRGFSFVQSATSGASAFCSQPLNLTEQFEMRRSGALEGLPGPE